MATVSAEKAVRAGALSRPLGITLAPINEVLIEAAVVDEWFQDEQANRLAGFGLGDDGRILAYTSFKLLVTEQAVTATGVYRRGVPVGVLAWTPRSFDSRRVAIHVHIAPGARGYGVASVALQQWLKVAFRDGVYRVEAEVLHINRPVIRGLEHFGFHREARLTAAWWMDDNLYDLIVLRLLRRDWKST